MGTAAPTVRRGGLRRAIATRPAWVAGAIGVLTIGTMILIAVGIGGPMKDLEVYLLAGRAFGRGANIYADGFGHVLTTPLPYTYPPSWAAALSLVAWLPRGWVGVGWTILNVALLLWVTRVSYRSFLDGQGTAWPVALACVAGIMAFSAPVLSVFDLGQVGILLLAMVLADTTPRRTRLPRGVLVGVATAIKLTPGVFLAYWIVTKRWRAAGTAIASAIGIWVVTALLRPDVSRTYWLDVALHPTRAGDLASVIDQSTNGLLLRLGWDAPELWVGLATLALAIGLIRARTAHGAGNELAAVALIGIAGVLASPVSWIHHAVWIVPATGVILGDGRDRGRRIAWTATVVLFLMHVPVWSTLIGLPGGRLTAVVLENAYVWAAWALLLFLPIGNDASEAVEVGGLGVSVP